MRTSDRRDFLMLAKTFTNQKIKGWWMSEKLDGSRAWWDGGITRGLKTEKIPWANLDKSYRPVSTGLWSRYGNVVCAPDWFLDLLPINVSLDGELYLGRGEFQEERSIVSSHTPDGRWHNIKFMIIDSPPLEVVLSDGVIKSPNFNKEIRRDLCKIFIPPQRPLYTFEKVYEEDLHQYENKVIQIVEQIEVRDKDHIDEQLLKVVALKGEGLILRNPHTIWTPHRTSDLLKVKKLHDSEGVVIGWEAGKGKHEGRMGSLLIKWRDITFSLGGFTDEERALGEHPSGLDVHPSHFPNGTIVTFAYRELSDDNIPKEARYLRK